MGGRLTGLVTEPGLALVRRRLGEFGEDDLARQLWLIRASLATLAEVEGHQGSPAPPWGTRRAPRAVQTSSPSRGASATGWRRWRCAAGRTPPGWGWTSPGRLIRAF